MAHGPSRDSAEHAGGWAGALQGEDLAHQVRRHLEWGFQGETVLPMTAPESTPTPVHTTMTTSLSAADGFAAIALAAVCWDGVMSMAGSRALRHALDYREPFRQYSDSEMVQLLNGLLARLRTQGAQHLMVDAASVLTPSQRGTAFAVAAEIMRSDGDLQEDEHNILSNLAAVLNLEESLTRDILQIMDVLHGNLE